MVIGTHALLSEQIKFRHLGLYIVDEEQRFGVFQKEKIKKNRPEVDVLTLSATPKPRTLTLSFSGVQDISIIESPPIGRLAIKNYVGSFSREILVSAVLNEMARQGQVFIVYNNIQRIFSFRDRIQDWLPGVSISVIHAQMNTAMIEANLLGFIKGDFQVLLSTTIIENGIDIPLVNTLIVVGADKFGLTQLYQLRGRIGRSSRQGLAYFLVDTPRLSDQQRLRLDAIREFTELGSGYKIAEFDLKIRGAGTLLGNRQHGHIEALGFDYYQKMLEETVATLKGEGETAAAVDVKFHFSYTLESDYISNTSERIAFYRRILESNDLDELEVIRAELEDRYGKTPDKVERIFFAAAIKLLARRCAFREIDVFPGYLEIRLDERVDTMPALKQRLLKLFEGSPGDLDQLTLEFKNYRKFIKKLSQIC